MANQSLTRHVHQSRTPARRSVSCRVRETIEREELSELIQIGQHVRARQDHLNAVFGELRGERKRQRQSLAVVAQRCGMDKGRLSTLESATHPNVTMDTIDRYAEALGKQVLITLADRAA